MVKAKVYKLVKEFNGLPKRSDFEIVEEELRPLKDGEILAQAIYISVDPYMRAYKLLVGKTMTGGQIAKITASKNVEYPIGKYIVGNFGWRTHTIWDGKTADDQFTEYQSYLLPNFGNLSPSLSLGVLGMPGNTAYFGFLEICKPKPRDTVVVSGAAGAVGSLVGQIAKIKGCKVIGIAGSDEKGQWLVNELGFDYFINYKTSDVDRELSDMAISGVDCYFDNVGGEISSKVLKHMACYGRVAVCGVISKYNRKDRRGGYNQFQILCKQVKVEGFIVWRWNDRWMEGIHQMAQWIKEGKLKYRETVTEGFDKIFDAFLDMLNGGNIGKAVVKIVNEQIEKHYFFTYHLISKSHFQTR